MRSMGRVRRMRSTVNLFGTIAPRRLPVTLPSPRWG